jgi:hypothetical protein
MCLTNHSSLNQSYQNTWVVIENGNWSKHSIIVFKCQKKQKSRIVYYWGESWFSGIHYLCYSEGSLFNSTIYNSNKNYMFYIYKTFSPTTTYDPSFLFEIFIKVHFGLDFCPIFHVLKAKALMQTNLYWQTLWCSLCSFKSFSINGYCPGTLNVL